MDLEEIKRNHRATHQSHCCVAHGCKYGSGDCPVVNKELIQDGCCEDCEYYGIFTPEEAMIANEKSHIQTLLRVRLLFEAYFEENIPDKKMMFIFKQINDIISSEL